MKQVREHYLQSLQNWNRVHRIVGAQSRPLETLVEESEEALASLIASNKEIGKRELLIDVGAGGGILGAPWLWMRPAQFRICLIEPDLKKSSFLIHYRSTLQSDQKSRLIILSEKLENVGCETIDRFAQSDSRFFAARAFSGEFELYETIRRSKFSKEPFFKFSDEGLGKSPRFVLKPVTI